MLDSFRPITEQDLTFAALVELINERFRTFNATPQGGGAFSGDMAGQRITRLGVPTLNTDAIPAGWADARYARKGAVAPPSPGTGGSASDVRVARDGFYSDSVTRPANEKVGELPSVLDFGAEGDGSTDDAAKIQKAIDALSAKGGGDLLIPAGYTFKVNSALNVPDDVRLVGQGEASIILRGANIADGKGVVDITGDRAGIANLKIDGAVTAAVGLQYGVTVPADPGDVALTKNSSVWVHGKSDISLYGVTIEHTGGYAVVLDARSANVDRVDVVGCTFRNNRPHKFGTTSGQLDFGSWTGGIIGISEGTNYRTAGVFISAGSFARGTGNQVWTWLPAFGKLHSNWVVDGCDFLDIGRDCVLLGGIANSVISNNTARRIGYMALADTGAATPKWLAGNYAVAFDTSGLAVNCTITNNAVLNCIGGGYDLDGFSQGIVDGNTCRVSRSGDVEYSEDAVSTWTNQCYGVNLGDTSNNIGGSSVQVTNNYFDNLDYGAIRFYAGQKGLVALNTIIGTASPTIGPISLGPLASSNQGCGDNVITANTIHYPAASAAPAIYEDVSYSTNFTGPNIVFGNRVIGSNAYEFKPVTQSASKTSFVLSTASVATSKDEMHLQVESTGSTKALKIYAVAAATVAQVLSLTKAGFLNISDNGTAGTGVLATGNRSTSAWPDAVVTSKVFGDGFLAIKHYGSGTFNSTEADALDNTHAEIRYNSAIPDIEKSVATAAGARVWVPIGLSVGSGPSVPGANQQVIFNDSGAFGADAGLYYDKANNLLVVVGTTGQATITNSTGFIQSQEGFYTPGSASTAINAPAGGVTALSHIAVRNDGAAGLTLVRSSSTARSWGLGVDSAGQLFIRDETASAVRQSFNPSTGAVTFSNQVIVGGAASGSGLLIQDGYVESTEGFYSPFSSYQTFQAPSGGIYARSMRAQSYMQAGNNFGPPSPTAGDGFQPGALYYNVASGRMEFFNGSVWQQLDVAGAAGVTSVNSSSFNLTASPSTGAVNLNFSLNPTFTTVALNGSGLVLNLFSGYGSSGGGWQTGSFAQNAIQAYSGGVLANQGFFLGNQFSWTTMINSLGQFVGNGLYTPNFGCAASGFNPNVGGLQYFGQSLDVNFPGGFFVNGFSFTRLVFKGGVLASIS